MAGDDGSQALGGLGDVGEFGGDVGRDDEGVAAVALVAGAPQGARVGAPGRDEGFNEIGGEWLIDVDDQDAGWAVLKGTRADGQRGGTALAEAGIGDDARWRALQGVAHFVQQASDDHDHLIDGRLGRQHVHLAPNQRDAAPGQEGLGLAHAG